MAKILTEKKEIEPKFIDGKWFSAYEVKQTCRNCGSDRLNLRLYSERVYFDEEAHQFKPTGIITRSWECWNCEIQSIFS